MRASEPLLLLGFSAAGVEFGGDGSRLEQLLDDEVALAFGDDSLYLGRSGVSADNEEAGRCASNRLVIGERKRYRLGARFGVALAKELERVVAARDILNSLVDLANERLVAGRVPPFFALRRHVVNLVLVAQ
jgi:hypothetical protein